MAEANVAAACGGLTGRALTTAKLAVLSPAFGIVALGGIIAFEWWKGKKDAQEFAPSEQEKT
ncbi:MAG: hypothetical protein MI863_11660 [Desulfobacterales bacterium]|nr:hypothetical protein [Desulfobacterales bacterium]